MKKITIFLFISIFFISISSNAQKISKEQAKADLKFCYDALKQIHPSVFRYTKENEFDNIYKFLDARIVDSMQSEELAEITSILLATTRCVHTNMSSPLQKKSSNYFNLNFVIHQNKLYARGFAGNSDTNLYSIVSINKIPSIEIIDKMLMLRSGDGYSQTFTEAIMSRNFNTYYNSLYKTPDNVSITVLDKNVEREFKVERTKKYSYKYKMFDWEGATVLDTMSGVKLYKLKNIPNTRVLRITSFKKKNATYYNKIFADMQRDSVAQLVIDLRQNGGGNIYHAFNLLNHLIEKDIYMYAEKRKTKAMPYLSTKGKIQYALGILLYDVVPNGQRWNDDNGKKYYRYSYASLNKTQFRPKVMVLTDGVTVSASSLVAAYLKYYNNADVLGVESGGTYTGNNGRSYAEAMLPNSKLKFRLPLQYINYFPGVPNVGRGVEVKHFMSPLLDKKSQELFLQDLLLENVE